ncbi:putative FAD dependent oxidoreductase [Rosellinia necatrix]|uniref:Putative FAD dependent oxidoreductase n=1 Tax=Rosellinia necatrix TaxID=77044 RepID=A0A1S8A777_ROSNE|nr:putative FAD dependent oxidoreductase [Rosellinia necatrix]
MRKHGLDIANKVALFELQNAEALENLILDEGIDCDFVPLTSGSAFVDKSEATDAKRLWDDMLKKGCDALEHVTYYGPDDAEKVSGVKEAVALYTFPAAVIW